MAEKISTRDVTRRQFLQAGVGLAAAAATRGKAMNATTESSRTFEHGDPLAEFNYGQVEFRAGVHQTQLEQTHGILMGLDEDSLLRPFRRAAGLAAPGSDLGGWYSDNEYGPPTFGQWISALSRYQAAMADELTRAKVQRLVAAFAATLEPTGAGERCQRPGGPSRL
jgi:hypothetical protein